MSLELTLLVCYSSDAVRRPLSYNLTIKTSFPTGFSGVAEITYATSRARYAF